MESQSKFENSTNPPSYEEVARSTATIVHEGGIGSGFFIDKNLLVTNYHVVKDAEDGGVFFRTKEGIKDNGDVVITDTESDLAIIQTSRNNYTPLEMSNDEDLKIGDEIFVIGSPEGFAGSFSKGSISTPRRGDLIQITASISPGSSGSPVFSKGFKVIGIAASFIKKGQNLNFAIPVSKLKNLIQNNKASLGRTETKEAVRQSESSFDRQLASCEKKKNKTPQEMLYLGLAYYLEGNYQKARLWLGEAAKQGNVFAQHNLGVMYEDGKGVVEDRQEALYWHEKAAYQGYASAQYNLALMYYYGKGVVKNYIEAYKWVILVKAQSNEDDEKINKLLDSLEKLMTPNQIAEAQKLVNQFEAQAQFKNGINRPSYEEVAKSTATIIHESAIGSGFFIEKNLLVTNYHVVENAKDGSVFFRTQEGIKDNGDVVVADAKSDLAIIRTFRNDYQALEIGSDEKLNMGDEIFVIGSPKGLGGTLSKGIISAKREDKGLIQITAPISSGSSGSPVFSKDFKVIGISVSYMPEGQNLNFAILVSKLRDLVQRNKVVLERTETEKAVGQAESNFDKLLESYENKKDKNPQEMMELGGAHYLKKNYQKAFLWFEKAANQGNVSAQFLFAMMYYNGEGVAKDYLKAIYWLEKAANQGEATAQYNLGVAYHKGKGVIKDCRKAFYWYQKAANQENISAQSNLGFMYNKGEGVAKDHQKALYWYEKAANQGLSEAQHNLGVMYYYGKGIVKDYKKAAYWYEKAANQGNVSAQSNLGFMYNEGEGTIKDYKKALYWLEKAANQGDKNAQYNLGVVYENDEGNGKDYQKILYWYQQSANQGNANAQFNLGRLYYYGEGVAKNYVEAYKWCILAKAPRNEHNEKINKLLDFLKKSMTPAQIAEAQKLASQFEVRGK